MVRRQERVRLAGWLCLAAAGTVMPCAGLAAESALFTDVSVSSGLARTLEGGGSIRPWRYAHRAAWGDADDDGRPDLFVGAFAGRPWFDGDGAPSPSFLFMNRSGGFEPVEDAALEPKSRNARCAGALFADLDGDGDLPQGDTFGLGLASWFEEVPSRLFRNTTGGRGLTVRVAGRGPGWNSMGVGAVVTAFAAGHLGERDHLLGRADIAIGTGYASGEEALAHFGLGDATRADLRVRWCGRQVDRRNVPAGSLCTIAMEQDRPEEKSPRKSRDAQPVLKYPPTLPEGREVVSFAGDALLERPATLRSDATVAKTAPRVDFLFFPGQTYEGRPWSNWGDSCFAQGKYYTAIGDHLAPEGNAFVFEYDPAARKMRKIADVRAVLGLPAAHYTPGKIHSHVDLGEDGWLYYSTHRGSTRATTDANHYLGDWILRTQPATGVTEVVARGPVPKHCLPNGVLDPKRLIFYGGTAPGTGGENEGIQFFAYDLRNRRVLYAGPNGPARSMILSRSTGRVYFTPGQSDSPLMRYDASSGKPPAAIAGTIGIRTATDETPQGVVYTISFGRKDADSTIYAFDVKSETVASLGPAAVGRNEYTAAVKADPSGRYLYYVPGAHGGSEVDHSAVVQFDTQTRTKKVIAFLNPCFRRQLKLAMKGTYGLAIDERGETLYITWNISRGSRAWDCCGLTSIHIPASERMPTKETP